MGATVGFAATDGLAFDSAEIVVSPVEVLSTADAGVTELVVVDAVVAESAEATVLSVFAASWRAQAAAEQRTLPTRMTRPSSDIEGENESSKQRFIDMLVRSCAMP